MTMNEIEQYLDYLFPNPVCELVYHSDYELLIATVLSAQSTDKRVNMVTSTMFSIYPSLEALKDASLDDLEEVIHPVGSFRKKAIYVREIANKLVSEYYCVVPRNREELMSFPGVGRKTANVFLSEFYHEPAFAVDTHVERIAKRLRLVNLSDDVLIIEKKLMKKFPKQDWGKRHLQMVLFGRYYCKAIKPECRDCRLNDICREKNKTK